MLVILSVICGLTLLCSGSLVSGSEFASNLPKCSKDDMKCLSNVINYYLKRGAGGIPSLGLRPIDPLFVEKMEIVQGNSRGPVNLRISLQNATIVGYSDLHITKIHGFNRDPHSTKLEVWGDIKRLTITGRYTIKGSVLILPIVGNGNANTTFDNLDFHSKYVTSVVNRNGQDYLKLKKVITNFNTTRMYMHMENLFNGDKLLGDTTNRFVDENWRDLFNELQPAIIKAVDVHNVAVVKPVFDKVPYAELYDNAITSEE